MARLGCLCGNGMSNSNCPSEDIIHIYRRGEIESALQKDPDITLWDFCSADRPYEFWYCRACGRVHQVRMDRLRIWHTFKREPASEYAAADTDSTWEKLCVYTDMEIDNITEKNFSMPLLEFARMPETFQYWYQPEKNIVQTYSTADNSFVFAYTPEAEYE